MHLTVSMSFVLVLSCCAVSCGSKSNNNEYEYENNTYDSTCSYSFIEDYNSLGEEFKKPSFGYVSASYEALAENIEESTQISDGIAVDRTPYTSQIDAIIEKFIDEHEGELSGLGCKAADTSTSSSYYPSSYQNTVYVDEAKIRSRADDISTAFDSVDLAIGEVADKYNEDMAEKVAKIKKSDLDDEDKDLLIEKLRKDTAAAIRKTAEEQKSEYE